jgi:hypothetical protein
MTEIVLTKIASGALIPADPQAAEFIAKIKLGGAVKAKVTRQRNPAFHRKMFALLNLGFEAWEPQGKEYKGEPVAKNFEQFRNDVTVLAGYYDTAITLKGETRLTAKSISFGAMDEDEFGKLYNEVVNVLLARVLTRYTRDDLDEVIERLMAFT